MSSRRAKVPCKEKCGAMARFNKLSDSFEELCYRCERKRRIRAERDKKLKAEQQMKIMERRLLDAHKELEAQKYENQIMEIEKMVYDAELAVKDAKEDNADTRKNLDEYYKKNMEV